VGHLIKGRHVTASNVDFVFPKIDYRFCGTLTDDFAKRTNVARTRTTLCRMARCVWDEDRSTGRFWSAKYFTCMDGLDGLQIFVEEKLPTLILILHWY